MEKSIKLILALLFLLCLASMPYGFYQLVRFLALIGFSVLAYKSFKEKREMEVLIYLALAILFQPIYKVALGRTLWNVIDVVVAVGLLVSIYKSKNT